LNVFSTPAISEAGKAVALTVVLSALVVYVPFAAPLVALALPLPLAYLVLRRGVRVGLAACLAVALLAGLLTGPVRGMVSLLLGGLVGVVVGYGLRRQWGASALLLAATAVASAGMVLSVAVIWVASGTGWREARNGMEASIDAAAEVYRKAGMAETDLAATVEQFKGFLDVMPYMSPAVVVVSGMLFAAGSLGLAAVVLPRVGGGWAARLSFAEFRLHWSFAYGFIAGLGLLLAAGWSDGNAQAFQLAGLNLIIIFQTLFFLQGLAVVHWVSVTRRLRPSTRTLLYSGALLGQLVFQLTTWAGLFDTWFDYRKRFAPPPSAPPQATMGGGATTKKEE
jgi:uncharacterized protein YybS (DUF2232 family)